MAFNPKALCYHYHYYELADFYEKARINGRSAVRLVEKHPELYERMIGNFVRTPQWRKLLRLGCLRLRGLKDTPAYWSALYDYHYASAINSCKRR
jgi:hypothetical protein